MPSWLRRMVEQSQEQNAKSFQMGVNMMLPRELTLTVELPPKPQDEPHFTVAVNLRSFANFFRFFMSKTGRAYKSARYTVDREDGSILVLGFYGGTLLASDNETTFRQAVDRIEQTWQQGQTLTFDLKYLKGNFDLAAIVKPRGRGWGFGELPADQAEIGIDIVSADEWKGDSVWLCRGEEEAKLLALALMMLRKELAQSAKQNGLSLSFQGQQGGNRYRLRFRLTGIKAWLKREF